MTIAVAMLVALALLTGCTADDSAQTPPDDDPVTTEAAPTPTEAAEALGTPVRIEDFSFTPDTLSVAEGDTVVWDYSQSGETQHSVDFRDGETSQVLRPGDTYQRTFEAGGSYPYVCRFHPDMTGRVTVQ